MTYMFQVPFKAEAFPTFAARRGVLRFSAGELAHALFVTGRAPGDQSRHGMSSTWEWLHRSSLVPAYLRLGPGDRLMKSALADSLDRSEKVSLSYALGQALTGVFCEQNLGVTHLMHVDRYAERWRLSFGAGRRRADLFGRIGPKRWVVGEAKGRSNGMETGLRQTLIEQKATVRTVAGHPPAVALGCAASFPLRSGGVRGSLRVDAFDPEPDKSAVDLAVNEDKFFRAYYEVFATAIDAGRRTEGPDGFIAASFGGSGVRVGMRRELYDAVMSGLRQDPTPWDEAVTPDQTPGARPDGTFVEADWNDALVLNDYETSG
jgi:hypothetical protein